MHLLDSPVRSYENCEYGIMSDRNGLKRSTQGGGGQPLEQDSTIVTP